MTLTLTDQQIEMLRQCIDLAVRNTDRKGVRVLVALDYEIEQQIQPAPEIKPEN